MSEAPPKSQPHADESPRGRSLALALVAALVAALAGGVLWAYVVKWSDYEVGILAWAIGFVAGTAAVLAAGGRRGPGLQGIAIASALVGILVGKHLSFALIVQEDAEQAGLDVGLFSGQMRDLFRDNLSDVFGWFDLLWIAFAVYSAWRIPRPEPTPAGAPPQA